MTEMNENITPKERATFPCAVARDLMPLYVENLTEDETAELMRAHISDCAACAQSYGMQKTKLEIEKKPKNPDFRGVRFFKKSYLKRIALAMAVLIMSVIILFGSYSYLFTNYVIDSGLVRVVGQYQLSNNRIVIAMQVDGYSINELSLYINEWEDHAAYDYSNGYRVLRSDNVLLMNASGNFVANRWETWTHKADERGDIFYYMFDPAAQDIEHVYDSWVYATSAPVTDSESAPDKKEEAVITPELQYVQLNSKRLWKAGDPLRELSAEEETVLLRAMEKAGFLESSVLLPEVDIIDTLMGK